MQDQVHPDIKQAHTLPSSFYLSEEIFQRMKGSVFYPSWQYLMARSETVEYHYIPGTILSGYLDEPVVIIRDNSEKLACYSNVCTHRGNILVHNPSSRKLMCCNYHGRCFGLNGNMRSMPGFEDVKGFPTPEDNLPQHHIEFLGQLLFVQIQAVTFLSETKMCTVDSEK